MVGDLSNDMAIEYDKENETVLPEHFINASFSVNETFNTSLTATETVSFKPLQPLGNIFLVIFVVGCLGNSLSIAVLARKHHRNSSTAIYLAALAVSDNFILIFGPLDSYMVVIWNINLAELGIVWCKIGVFFPYATVATASWLLIAVTIERVFSVIFPHKFKTACTANLAKIVVIAIWIVAYTINLHLIFGFGYTEETDEHGLHCHTLSDHYNNFFVSVLPWIVLTLMFAVPYIFILFGNIIIIIQVTRRVMQRKQRKTSGSSFNMTMTVTLVLVNIAFLFTVAPITIVDVLIPVDGFSNPDSSRWVLNLKLNALLNVNAAINFFLYFLCGSKFRADLKAMLCRCRNTTPNP